MTTSRMGIMGSLRFSNFSLGVVTNAPNNIELLSQKASSCSLSCLLHHSKRNVTFFNHFPSHFEFLDFLLARERVHQVHHQLVQDHTQAASAPFSGHCLA